MLSASWDESQELGRGDDFGEQIDETVEQICQMPGPRSIPTAQWPEIVLSYEGCQDFPALESYRTDLLLPGEPEML